MVELSEMVCRAAFGPLKRILKTPLMIFDTNRISAGARVKEPCWEVSWLERLVSRRGLNCAASDCNGIEGNEPGILLSAWRRVRPVAV
jgi:hypothetical protein